MCGLTDESYTISSNRFSKEYSGKSTRLVIFIPTIETNKNATTAVQFITCFEICFFAFSAYSTKIGSTSTHESDHLSHSFFRQVMCVSGEMTGMFISLFFWILMQHIIEEISSNMFANAAIDRYAMTQSVIFISPHSICQTTYQVKLFMKNSGICENREFCACHRIT